MYKYFLPIVAIFLAVAGAYGNSLWGDFTFDDDGYILRNPLVKGTPVSEKQFDYKITEGNQLRLRMLSIYTYRANYLLHGFRFLPGWHLFNVIVHFGCSVMLYLLLQLIEGTGKLPRGTAVISALVFAVWPIGSEAVNYLSARQTVLMAFFTISSVYFALRVIHSETMASRSAYSLCALISWGCAMLSKEVGVIFPPLLIITAVLAFSKDVRWFLRWHRTAVLFVAGGIVVFAVVSGVVAYTVKPDIFKQVKRKYNIVDDDVAFHPYRMNKVTGEKEFTPEENLKAYEFSRLREFPRTLSLMLGPLPGRLSIDHHTPWIAELDWRAVIGAVLLLCLLGGIICGLFRAPPVGFGLALFFVPLAPYWIIPSMIIVEYKLHMPLMGLALCFGYVVARFYSTLPGKRRLLVIPPILLLLIWGAIMSAIRNVDWRDPVNLWQKAELNAPDKARPPLFVGVHLYDKAKREKDPTKKRNQFALAAKYLTSAARKYAANPLHRGSTYTLAYSNLAMANYRLGNLKEACNALNKGAGWRPEVDSLIRGVVAMRGGRFAKAEKEFKRALKIKPDYVEVMQNYSRLYALQFKFKEAASMASIAIRHAPGDPMSRMLLAGAKLGEGDIEQAKNTIKPVIENYPDFAEANYLMAYALLEEEKSVEALQHLHEAKKKNLDDWRVNYKLGEAYINLSKWQEAVQALGKAAELSKAAEQTQIRGVLYRKLALSYHKLGNEEKARAAAKRARDIGETLPKELEELLSSKPQEKPR
ncbi:MAG: tetratricopeptide repeat protein [Planctomycetota bacterium]|jgi:tetratricopeptide (TPR) repeat protein